MIVTCDELTKARQRRYVCAESRLQRSCSRGSRVSSSSDPKHPQNRPRRGDFGWQPLVSCIRADARRHDVRPLVFRHASPRPCTCGALSVTRNGDLYSPMRRIPAGLPGDCAGFASVFLPLHDQGSRRTGMLMHPVGKRSAPNNGFTKTLEGDRIHWRSDPAQPGNPFHVTWTPDDCSWVEEGAMDIRGKLLEAGNALVFARARRRHVLRREHLRDGRHDPRPQGSRH